MKILITGASGYLGFNFIEKYKDVFDIIALVKSEKSTMLKEFKNVKIEKADITKKGLLQLFNKHKPDVVLHLASLNQKELVVRDAFDVNVFGTFNVVQACLEIGAKLIFTSSREVYGNKSNTTSCKENSVLNPSNIYGITKMFGESIIRHSSKNNNLNFIILRITNVYGPNGDKGLNKILTDAINKNKITILGGEQEINPIYIEDVVEILKKSINKKFNKKIINVGSRETIKIKKICKIIHDSLNTNVKIEIKKFPKETTFTFKPDITKMEKTFDITPIPLKKGIKKTLEFYDKK
jgi:UDP-glucose 4-epimerase